ncbi:MAG: DUF4158 domain-containing protein, partial [bacterium]
MPSIKRIYLLSEAEIVDVYARPDFNQCEKELYFTLNTRELDILNRYSNIRTRVYFILQLGYFKAKQRFFNFNFEDVLTDVEYILSKHSDDSKTILSGQISRNYADQQKNDILELLGYQDWLPKYSLQTEARICELLRYYPKIHNAVRQLLSYFESQNIIAPTYRKLQDMFTGAFSSEEKRLDAIILSIPRRKKKQFADLIALDDGISQLNIIRADQKNFKYTAVRYEVDKAQKISDLYEFAKNFIPKLKLSKNAIRYYADVAEQYTTSRLRRLSKSQQLLHAICFIYHRYQQIMDNLIISFIYHIRSIMNDGKIYAETELTKHSINMVASFPQLAQFLKWFPNRNNKLTHEELDKEAYKILPE